MSTKSTPVIPKSISVIVKREAELQSSVDRWSVESFRMERDRLESLVHSGLATDADIESHSQSRDGGPLDRDYVSMCASSSAALDAFRRSNWEAFREYLRIRLDARLEKEAQIVIELAQLCLKHGIEISHNDPEASTTRQLEEIVQRESAGWIRFGSAVEIY
ncbi:MAG: hypothetical protein K8R57_08660 [Verrucomicrobia bacterium]|nr:hypothetical protein [Verrucomicrobiota bacterium]